MSDTPIWQMTAVEIAASVRSGQLSAVEVTDAILARTARSGLRGRSAIKRNKAVTKTILYTPSGFWHLGFLRIPFWGNQTIQP